MNELGVTMMKLPEISVIVPVWNRPEDLSRCLTSLAEQTLSQERFEVIVVDNGSTDSTPNVARSAGATVVVEPQPGSYAARNRGLEIARGAWIAFIDSDCRADAAWLQMGLDRLRTSPNAGIIAGRIELEGGSNGVADHFERLFAFDQAKSVAGGRATTANWLSPTSLLRQQRGFRSELRSGGDFELAKRLVKAGHAIIYAPEMVVFHPTRATIRELVAKRQRVVGGAFSGSNSSGRFAVRMARTTVYRVRQVIFNTRLSFDVRVKVSALLVLLLAVSWIEMMRLMFGGEARRA